MRRLIYFFVPVLLAVVIANLLTPFIYRVLPSDFTRTKLILRTLETPGDSTPEIYLFGSSVLMSGIDAKLMSKHLNNRVILNLGSLGQSLKESVLFYPKVPPGAKKVIQFITIEDLTGNQKFPSKQVINNLRLFGYYPDNEINKLLLPDEVKLLSRNKLTINYEARTILVTTFNRQFRKFLRKDLDFSIENDLYFPNIYQQRINQDAYKLLINRYNPPKSITVFNMNDSALVFLKKLNQFFKNRSVEYILVIYPINPDLTNYTDLLKNEISTATDTCGLKIINCTALVPGCDFIDNGHIGLEGAKKFTIYLANQLKVREE